MQTPTDATGYPSAAAMPVPPAPTVLPGALVVPVPGSGSNMSVEPGPGAFSVPAAVPAGELRNLIDQACKQVTIRDVRLAELADEYEADPSTLAEKYRPQNTKDDFWAATKDLMLHMNTTRIAMRSLGGVYSGSQTRRVNGSGQFASELHDLANSDLWRQAMVANYLNAVLFGTSAATATYDDEIGVDLVLHDPVRTHLDADPTNVRKLKSVIEFDRLGRWMRVVSRHGCGLIRAGASDPGDLVTYEKELPQMPTEVAYGEDRRARGYLYGGSLVAITPGYNKILSNCYYCLGLLIKWQSRSLLIISSGKDGGESALPKKIRQINGNTAFLLGSDDKAEFISPAAKFSEILDVINSYLTFLAVSLGLPKSVFMPQDNASAQSARLEGAPLISTLRGLARQFEGTERALLYKAAFVRHLQDGRAYSMADLRAMYQVVVRIDPYDYTDDVNSNASALVSLVQNGIIRLKDAIRRANPEMTETEIEDHIGEVQAKAVAELQSKAEAAKQLPAPQPPPTNQDAAAAAE